MLGRIIVNEIYMNDKQTLSAQSIGGIAGLSYSLEQRLSSVPEAISILMLSVSLLNRVGGSKFIVQGST
jgi:hypothetical protein